MKRILILVIISIMLQIHLNCSSILNDNEADPQGPNAVVLYTPTTVYSTAAALSWTSTKSKYFAAYKVYYDIVPDVSKEKSILATNILLKNDTSYQLAGLWQNTTYYVKIFVYNGETYNTSNQINFTTTACNCGVYTDERDGGMVRIPSGCFVGKDSSFGVISYDYFMDTIEVTEAQWFKVMDDSVVNSLKPKSRISWLETILYCNKKSIQNGLDTCYTYASIVIDTFSGKMVDFKDIECDQYKYGYRLPTEDEWEYAYRAGGWEEYYWGKDGNTSLVHPFTTSYPKNLDDSMEISEYAWWDHNDDPDEARDVALLKPNKWHLYDMAGNVQEFVWDLASEERVKSRFNYKGPEIGPMSERQRIIRGGRYDFRYIELTAWYRLKKTSVYIDFSLNIGFRTVRRAN